MLQIIFGGLMGAALLGGMIAGRGPEVVSAMLTAAESAVAAALSMAGGFAFFCGLIAILQKAGVLSGLARRAAPIFRWLMGRDVPGDALEYVTMNLCANLLGMGNAATPMGIEAAKRMADGERASNALCLFLVMNAASVEILPTSVIALRSAAGSTDPASVVGPTLLVTLLSALAGIGCCKLMEKRK